MQDTAELLDFAKRVARESGEIISKYFDMADKAVQTKENDTPVTIADKLINQLVIDRVHATFPNHGILAEEGSYKEDRNELWVCDPIDGTKGFIQRIPTALFSLAYVVDGRTEVAVMFDPFQNKLFGAIHGKGAWVDDRPINVTACKELSQARIGVSGSYKELKARLPFFDSLAATGAELVMVPGNVFRDTLVANGDIDGCIFPGRSAHDIAAAKLIVEEAGGKVTDLYGKDQRYDGKIFGAILTNGRFHDQLVELMNAFGPENYVGY